VVKSVKKVWKFPASVVLVESKLLLELELEDAVEGVVPETTGLAVIASVDAMFRLLRP
jgi:hypothetical protein